MKKIFLLLILLIISTNITIKSQPDNVLVEDNFSDNYYKWWTGRNNIARAYIARGEYILSYLGHKSWSSNINVRLKRNDDFVIETKISRMSGSHENGYGITWGKGRRGYYNFIITHKGRFYVRRVEQGRRGKYLVNWTSTPHINRTISTNKLRIQKKGNNLMFFINGQMVAEIPNQPFFGNQVGFMMYKQQQIAIDYMVVFGGKSEVNYPLEEPDNQQIVRKTIKKPNLKILQLAINDTEDIEDANSTYGNANSIIEPGEAVEITAFVQNFGNETANNVSVKLKLDINDRNISCPDTYKDFNIGKIESGAYKKFKFFFFTSKRYKHKDIPFKVVIKSDNDGYKTSQKLGLKMNERTSNIVDIDINKQKYEQHVAMEQISEIIEIADVDKNIPRTRFDGSKTLAVVIGIENYKYAPIVDFAKRDAQVFYKYALSVFGVPKQNIYFLTNTEATLGEMKKIFSKDGWLARRSIKNESNIIVYYAGHGAPDIKSKEAFLIPYDIDPNYAKTGFKLNSLYSALSSLKAKSVTVFIDACFSGKSRNDKMLIAGARSVVIPTESSAISAKNMAIMSASTDKEFSSAYPEKHHGIFTYYLLKELKNNANSLNSLSIRQFHQNIKQNVKKTAGFLDKEQNPSLIGNNKDRAVVMETAE